MAQQRQVKSFTLIAGLVLSVTGFILSMDDTELTYQTIFISCIYEFIFAFISLFHLLHLLLPSCSLALSISNNRA